MKSKTWKTIGIKEEKGWSMATGDSQWAWPQGTASHKRLSFFPGGIATLPSTVVGSSILPAE